ncbi:MAG: bifunctional 2-C-methyl-D-erythritol 4-phosphate cytidylyltransferase/2-C-methyl-D-erythritol 2,4-cyclodiphosphate synthase [Pseudomonadota bacterium]
MTTLSADAVVLAAGRGTRLGGPVAKQYLEMGGRTVVARSIDAFLTHPRIRRVCVAIGAHDWDAFSDAIGTRTDKVMTVVGGQSRQDSVNAALEALRSDPPDCVLIHDGARPFVSGELITGVLDALECTPAVIPAIPVADTLKRVEDTVITETVPRDGLHQAQTPQGFHYGALVSAHAKAQKALTDDAGVMEAAGHPVSVVPGERSNFKLTTQDDLIEASRAMGGITAIGQGFDVHQLGEGGPLILGGLRLPEPMHLVGHSDADVALHALTDALFGAIADGDIGHHFPPSDPLWKGASSDQFLAFAAQRVAELGEIIHLDLTIICERPKIGPVREAMRARIAEICRVGVEQVSVKATTTERLGFTGRGEGIAAQAIATIRRAAIAQA